MKIEEVEVFQVKLPVKEPFKVSFGEMREQVSVVLKILRMLAISLASFGVVVRRTIDVDSCLLLVVHEIRTAAALFDESLGTRRQPQFVRFEPVEPVLLQSGAREALQLGKMLSAGKLGGSRLDIRRGKLQEDVADRVAVEEFVFPLVAVAHHAVVAGGATVFLCARCAAQVVARVGIEMANGQCFAGHTAKGAAIFDELTEYAGPPLR